MAQLKDLIVAGASRFIGDIYANKAQLTSLSAPTSAGGTTYGAGTSGQVLKTNGSTLYWSSVNALTSARNIDGISFNGSADITHYTTCGTAAGTAAKTADMTGFSLDAGSIINVKFTNTNTANSPTLNVNSTGAKNIYHRGVQITSGDNKGLLTGIVSFIYDGSQWHIISDTWYKASTTSVGSASAGTAISADDITAWTTNTPTVVTKKTVVTGGTTTSIPNVTGVGSAPSLSYTARSVGSASGWSAGTAASASYSNGILTITNGTAPSLTVTSVACDDITAWSAGSTPTLGTAIDAYTGLTTGDSVSVTAGTAASLSYTSRSIPNISVSSQTVVTGITGS